MNACALNGTGSGSTQVPQTTCGAEQDAPSLIATVIHERKNTAPRHLCAPGPSIAQLGELLKAAAAAPDHGRFTPWRFISIPNRSRVHLAQAFQSALRERDRDATAKQIEAAGDKAYRSPTLLLAVVDLSDEESNIPDQERLVSLGCAIQNMLLLARALGFGSGLSSGLALQSEALRRMFALRAAETAVCFVSFGTVDADRPCRSRPGPEEFFSVCGEFAGSPRVAEFAGKSLSPTDQGFADPALSPSDF